MARDEDPHMERVIEGSLDIATQLEEVLTCLRDDFLEVAQGGKTVTRDQAAALGVKLEALRQTAAALVATARILGGEAGPLPPARVM